MDDPDPSSEPSPEPSRPLLENAWFFSNLETDDEAPEREDELEIDEDAEWEEPSLLPLLLLAFELLLPAATLSLTRGRAEHTN